MPFDFKKTVPETSDEMSENIGVFRDGSQEEAIDAAVITFILSGVYKSNGYDKNA